MPISSIITQPTASSINAAYRPILFLVRATRTDGDAIPPVVYCDIYINSVFYKTLPKTQYLVNNGSSTDWQFDIQDATQEMLRSNISPNGGSNIITDVAPLITVQCKFRSSGFDINNFIQYEGTQPIQGTGTTSPTSGDGTASNTFYVVNSTLQHHQNQVLTTHLNSYKSGTWNSGTYPLTHRLDGYRLCKRSSDYFPIVSSLTVNCVKVFYKYKGSAIWNSESACGGGGGCNGVSIIGPTNLPNGTVGSPYSYIVNLSGDAPFTISGITSKPTWMTITISGSTIIFGGTPNATATNFSVHFNVNNCGGSVPFDGTVTIGSACVNASYISGMPTLPDATIGQPYSFSFAVNGTSPITLGSISKPGWMSIVPSGNTITFSGTPTAIATGVPVSFNILNCTSGSLAFSRTINITTATADLTFQFFHSGSSFLSFSVSLDQSIDASVNVSEMFADGFADCDDCNGIGDAGAIASAQFNAVGGNMVIAAGGTGTSHDPEIVTGDWSLVNCVRVYNVIVNGSPHTDGAVVTIGSYDVTIHIQECT